MSNLKLSRVLLLFILAISSIPVVAASEKSLPVWSLHKCLVSGIASHPLILISKSSVQVGKSIVKQSQSSFNPKVNLRGGWTHRRDEFIRNRNLPSSSELTTDSTGEAVSISKLVIDSGAVSAQIAAAKKSVKASEMDQKARIIEIAAGIKKAFFRVLRSKELLNIQKETLEGYLTHLEKVKGYVEVGTRPAYDITKAKVDVANARVDVIKAKSLLRQSQVALSRAIGIKYYIALEHPLLLDNAVYSKFDIGKNMKECPDRPELQSLKLAIEADKLKVREAKSSLKPYVSANAEYNWAGNASPLNRTWSAGVSLNWPIFDGQLSDAKIKNAKWRLESARANLDNLKLNISTEIENAITNFKDASERFEATKILVVQAKEAKDLAEGRYDAGLGSPIEITDARVGYAKARGNNIIALYDRLIAIAELDRVHGRLPEEIQISADNNVEIIVK